ncbi:MAG: chorismate mutase, partial [Bilophila sp.]
MNSTQRTETALPDTSATAILQATTTLAELRQGIDGVDRALLALLNQRAALSLQVGQLKAGSAGPIFRPQREREILEHLARENPGPLPAVHIQSIWREIFSSSRTLQQPLGVAYLGPEGTHSHFAALGFLGQLMAYQPCKDFHEVFASVAEGHCALGVVPLENALQGTVGPCFDLFMEYEVFIQAEFLSRIQHCLLSSATSLEVVHTVYSHPQALAQCQRWLRQHLPHA